MVRDTKILVIFLLVLSCMVACATGPETKPNGVYHRVKKGETLWRIAQTYNCDLDRLAEANNLPDSSIEAGSVLFIPNASRSVDITSGSTSSRKTYTATRKKSPEVERKSTVSNSGNISNRHSSRSSKLSFVWPVKGKVSSKFGKYKGMQHNGIKIDGKAGMPVIASAGGIVIHSAPIKYYGETIIIKHNQTYSTVYSHLKKREVLTGSTVRKGEQIGVLGGEKTTGKPCLHFEVRYKNRAKNPLYYLPK